ncbi:MAG: type II secretion system F family protein [Thiomonas sp.]|jgi:type IV pilus assembly protein PilC|uniref:Type 4 fimbrial assembly protein n=1 Tax=Thiomonas arsenitoxydans (strain DSM 22701 / CIP 110005 / 3As) TaxID=426114 RepID=D6CRC7_THIA3|nr:MULTISPECIES: type II secretion system F family protein [Thiomonas]MDE1978464.1 type II secretion system F family protein [Betaproteobacteria bacterium]OYV31798.1 MAG: type II secretion system protein F [Thiomonas sp. 20-64-9]MBN8775348.1 type II secretion system F family protein [Thiomonas arsenitoxydans]MDE2267629.1 type II secretion system F family protein [Betaproteobacteria bacterium]OZB69914.1 MAG: type II secretion system protein F [Thiomonas sp. 13-64-67]
MATAAARTAKEALFEWEGKDRQGKLQRGELRAGSEAIVSASLRRQGILVTKVKKRRLTSGKAIKAKDISTFTRQMSTMIKAGVPLLQSFDIVGRGHPNPNMARLIMDIRGDVETGTSLSNAFRKHPKYFDALYCNLVEAGETAGMLELVLDRLATYQEKSLAIRSKIKSALTYPIAVMVVAFVVVSIIMLFVVPVFTDVFSQFGASLPAPTLMVVAISNFFVHYWYILFGTIFLGGYFFLQSWKKSIKMQETMDRLLLRVPVFGKLVRLGALARWTRTLATMFGAGVPLVEALDAVGGAAGNIVYLRATEKIQQDVSTGTSLTTSMQTQGVFPPLVIQLTSIGEESGSLDSMLSKAADIYEAEVDELVKNLSALLEPIIIVFLGVIIGGLVVAMYLPIFNLGKVVG